MRIDGSLRAWAFLGPSRVLSWRTASGGAAGALSSCEGERVIASPCVSSQRARSHYCVHWRWLWQEKGARRRRWARKAIRASEHRHTKRRPRHTRRSKAPAHAGRAAAGGPSRARSERAAGAAAGRREPVRHPGEQPVLLDRGRLRPQQVIQARLAVGMAWRQGAASGEAPARPTSPLHMQVLPAAPQQQPQGHVHSVLAVLPLLQHLGRVPALVRLRCGSALHLQHRLRAGHVLRHQRQQPGPSLPGEEV